MDEYIKSREFELPCAVAADMRLTKETMRVLMALYYFRSSESDLTLFPSRKFLSDLCSIHPSNISSATSRLVELGWVKKEGNKYTLTIPAEITEMVELSRARSQHRQENRRPSIPISVKKYVFERDAYRCVKCASYKDLCADHIYPLSLGGSSDPDNLQTLCWTCNSKKSNKVEA